MAEFYNEMAQVLGLRLRPPFDDFATLAAVGASVIEGLALRQIMTPSAVERTYTLTESQHTGEWSIPALRFLAIVDMIFEAVPPRQYNRDAALAAYSEYLAKATEAAEVVPAGPPYDSET
jgi:hypothetical protein